MLLVCRGSMSRSQPLWLQYSARGPAAEFQVLMGKDFQRPQHPPSLQHSRRLGDDSKEPSLYNIYRSLSLALAGSLLIKNVFVSRTATSPIPSKSLDHAEKLQLHLSLGPYPRRPLEANLPKASLPPTDPQQVHKLQQSTLAQGSAYLPTLKARSYIADLRKNESGLVSEAAAAKTSYLAKRVINLDSFEGGRQLFA